MLKRGTSNILKQMMVKRPQPMARLAQMSLMQQCYQPKINFFQPIISNRNYFKDNVLMEREYGDGYMMDPTETAERIVRVIALHDHCKDPASITLAHTFEELGLNPLDMCEIHMAVEKEFDFEMAEDIVETWTTVNDFVEHVARDFYAK